MSESIEIADSSSSTRLGFPDMFFFEEQFKNTQWHYDRIMLHNDLEISKPERHFICTAIELHSDYLGLETVDEAAIFERTLITFLLDELVIQESILGQKIEKNSAGRLKDDEFERKLRELIDFFEKLLKSVGDEFGFDDQDRNGYLQKKKEILSGSKKTVELEPLNLPTIHSGKTTNFRDGVYGTLTRLKYQLSNILSTNWSKVSQELGRFSQEFTLYIEDALINKADIVRNKQHLEKYVMEGFQIIISQYNFGKDFSIQLADSGFVSYNAHINCIKVTFKINSRDDIPGWIPMMDSRGLNSFEGSFHHPEKGSLETIFGDYLQECVSLLQLVSSTRDVTRKFEIIEKERELQSIYFSLHSGSGYYGGSIKNNYEDALVNLKVIDEIYNARRSLLDAIQYMGSENFIAMLHNANYNNLDAIIEQINENRFLFLPISSDFSNYQKVKDIDTGNEVLMGVQKSGNMFYFRAPNSSNYISFNSYDPSTREFTGLKSHYKSNMIMSESIKRDSYGKKEMCIMRARDSYKIDNMALLEKISYYMKTQKEAEFDTPGLGRYIHNKDENGYWKKISLNVVNNALCIQTFGGDEEKISDQRILQQTHAIVYEALQYAQREQAKELKNKE